MIYITDFEIGQVYKLVDCYSCYYSCLFLITHYIGNDKVEILFSDGSYGPFYLYDLLKHNICIC